MSSSRPPGTGGGVRESTLVAATELVARAAQLLAEGFRLATVAAHDDRQGFRVVYVFVGGPPDRRVELQVRLDASRPSVPSLGHLSFPASRFEREMHDLFGIVPTGHPFLRPLVLHQHWPREWHPMRHGAGSAPAMRDDAEPFPFVQVEGPGVYEIPVGPVHAGLIEPGHFRFSVVGETIIAMKARLWFVHRGMERLFEGRDVESGVALAERISGDSAIGHNLAYCLAVEEACGIAVPEEAAGLRALLLELERIYNHVADVGALCNDAGFGLGQARALVLREQLLRLNRDVTGHRLLRGAIRPGGAAVRRLPTEAELDETRSQFDALVELAMANTVVMDRFRGTAVLGEPDARATGTLGVVARASGLDLDARRAHPSVELGGCFRVARATSGDVMARFLVRVEEVRTSLDVVTELARAATALGTPGLGTPGSGRSRPGGSGLGGSGLGGSGLGGSGLGGSGLGGSGLGGSGLGIVEGWRGTIVHRVETDTSGMLARCKVVDPSFLNWPALSVALADTIVPDFPLANKSFNLSYAGNDL